MVNMLDLINEYGTIEDIPQSELDINGLTRIIKDGVSRLVLTDNYQHESNAETTMIPFKTIEIDVEVSDVNIIRSRNIIERIKKVDNIFIDDREEFSIKVLNEIQREFLDRFEYIKFCFFSGPEGDIIFDYVQDLYNLYLEFINSLSTDYNLRDLLLEYELLFQEIQSKLEELYLKYIKLKGKFQDKEMPRQLLRGNLEKQISLDDFVEHVEFTGKDSDFLINLKQVELTGFDYLKYAISNTLEEKGFIDIVEYISGAKNVEELVIKLKNSINLLPLFNEYSNYSKRIKKESDIERKRNLSKDFSLVKEQFNIQKNIINSLVSFLTLEDTLANYLKSVSNAIGELFKIKKSGKKTEKMYLNGEIDHNLDENPGKISGDCSYGRPLPFGKLKGLSNIKVFNNSKAHIGNIYLYEANIGGEKIWHIDAIQVPSIYDWDNLVLDMLSKMGKSAKEKGVSKIVVSENGVHISNYDYIEAAILKHHKNKGLGKISGGFIEEHNFSGHMQLQSIDDESFLIVWEA